MAVRLWVMRVLLITAAASVVMPSWAQDSGIGCGPVSGRYGPFDYLNPRHRAAHLPVVERVHFNQRVRMLKKNGSTGSLAKDLEYVLNWFPNHHGALDALSRLAHREGSSERPHEAHSSVACRFQWAKQVNSSDSMIPVIEGLHYYRFGRYKLASGKLRYAIKMSPSNALAHYNLGLVLLKMKDYAGAKKHARRAYELNFPLPGLRTLLARAGHPIP